MEIKPKKSLGQNFLINTGILVKIVSAAELSPNDTVLEIGPGTGNLTKLLSQRAGKIIAIEKDRRLIEDLKIKFPNVKVIEEDILEFNPKEHGLKEGAYKIAANIPYYITSSLLRTIFEKWPKPKLIILTVQREVAKRIVANPPDMSLLALSVQFYSSPEIIGYVSRGSFRPMPKVDSAIIKITPHNKPPATDPEMFFRLARAGFSEKRKQLVNNLVKNFGMMREDLLKILEKGGIKPDIRAENLSLNQWIELSKLMKK
jgi:16S rRNA (adenine1518-N6/adenine1519-N6)-dimethyltransferase